MTLNETGNNKGALFPEKMENAWIFFLCPKERNAIEINPQE
jgi:hypothetical protein